MFEFLCQDENLINKIKEKVSAYKLSEELLNSELANDKNYVFVINEEKYIPKIKLNYNLNKYPVIYINNDKKEHFEISPDFILDELDESILETIDKFFRKRKVLLNHLKITVPSTIDKIQQLLDISYDFIKTFYGEEYALYLKLVIDEAVSNAYIHGNKKDPNKKISLELKHYVSKIDITVTDEGNGFNIKEVMNEIEKNNLSEHGRGILIMRSLMDEVNYLYKGNIINMIKYSAVKGEL